MSAAGAPPASCADVGDGRSRTGIYVASRSRHGERWKRLRDVDGLPIVSTWIDEAGQGRTADWPGLWRRCTREAASAAVFVLVREPGEDMVGAWIEMGAALEAGVPVLAVGIDGLDVAKDTRIRTFPAVEYAFEEAERLVRIANGPVRTGDAPASVMGAREKALEAAADLFLCWWYAKEGPDGGPVFKTEVVKHVEAAIALPWDEFRGPCLPGADTGVLPLEWQARGEFVRQARPAIGVLYEIQELGSWTARPWRLSIGEVDETKGSATFFPDAGSAEAAAQADHETRVLSSLRSRPVPDAGTALRTGASLFGAGLLAGLYDSFVADPDLSSYLRPHYERGLAGLPAPSDMRDPPYAAWLAGRHAPAGGNPPPHAEPARSSNDPGETS